ncbi:MAG: aminotransferase class I/II-fold pyridoxal phosphate-dependent enzyme [Gemmatimonadetes bacterium]|uniref:Aminotransferase n=1 Tax=Candidatus Kutchimonas denitrificans TaxID=3056748 RepID=A0AAE4Z7A1_9BACT|nr:aminotransferase class I/II-fold pyridoxal phosphate-dependent enzyme [Gemmatimonadota bacterium]NIR74022.1 aminotransferase class I/II-fold pyridoxal phosphate-dependent enzyme [Candidatus Kutchimonas denitrificans]NIS03011.1 aminotransferase class I/II-fold pyridoxal phosphate-dependent enzyme [Gemmatimonadota bacterium]NIT68728.1 aminotransferase class I/II-fold pyridoxal phosphate-dependent enzyme [Gemmatimonadota bacterium]NIU53309.1 aminotransferase class I/II-fold pyridoxal phosphate-
MERRDFLKAGLALGAAAGGGIVTLANAKTAPDLRPGETLRLNSNENPLGLSPAARRAILDGLDEANRYPRDSRVQLIEALAALHGVEPENIVLGNGSTEVLQMSVQALATPRSRLVLADPTFEDVPWYALPFPYELVRVPLDGRFAHDLEAMRRAASSAAGPALVYICNPNNPTGTLTPSAEIDDWIEAAPETVSFLVDEAYFEYCEDPAYWSCVKWVDKPNVIVARSFSKIYGMAGIRLGYGVAHDETAGRLRQFIGKNNANHLVLVAALAALNDEGLIPRSRAANAEGMNILHRALDELGLEYLPSHTNFVMHRIRGELDTYRERMAAHGVRVGRPFPPMLDYNRLSIGLPEEMSRFVEVLREFRSAGWV